MQVSSSQFMDLCTLTVANWLEQRPRARVEHQYIRKEEFRAMLPLLGEVARLELETAYGF